MNKELEINCRGESAYSITAPLERHCTSDWLDSANYAMQYLDKTYNRRHLGMRLTNLPDKVIFNDKKKATTLLYSNHNTIDNDYEATVVKACDGDKYDKKMGFLIAYFKKHSGLTRTQANKYMKELLEDK